MDAYIDYNNFRAFLRKLDHPQFVRCNDFLLEKFNLKFTFPEKNKEELEIEDEFYPEWARLFADGANNNTIEYGVNYPSRPINEEEFFHADLRKLSSVYMLSNEDGEKVHGKGLLVAKEGEELDVLSDLGVARLSNNGKTFDSTKRYDIQSETKETWEYIAKNASPCTDIVIVDRYIFMPKDGLASDRFYENNICDLLTKLTARTKNIPVNIVIFAYIWADKIKVPIYKTVSKLKSMLAQTIGVEPRITIVNAGSEEHDRYIFTNYKSISSGDSFAYYGRDRSLETKGRFGYVTSLADDEEFQTNCKVMDDLQLLVDDPHTIIMGDCASNFLALGINPAPMLGEPVHLQREQDEDNVLIFSGNAITSNPWWLKKLTDEELEQKTFEVTKLCLNAKEHQNRFPYFIEVEEMQ